MNFILFDKLDYSDKEEFAAKFLKLKEKDYDEDSGLERPQVLYNKLANLDTAEQIYMVRKIMLGSYGGNLPQTPFAYIIRKIAEAYKDIPIKQFEAEQEEIRKKRVDNADKRIQALKPEKPKKAEKMGASKLGKGLAALLNDNESKPDASQFVKTRSTKKATPHAG